MSQSSILVHNCGEESKFIYNKYSDNPLIGLLNTETKEIHLFPALKERVILSEETDGSYNAYVYREKLKSSVLDRSEKASENHSK